MYNHSPDEILRSTCIDLAIRAGADKADLLRIAGDIEQYIRGTQSAGPGVASGLMRQAAMGAQIGGAAADKFSLRP